MSERHFDRWGRAGRFPGIVWDHISEICPCLDAGSQAWIIDN